MTFSFDKEKTFMGILLSTFRNSIVKSEIRRTKFDRPSQHVSISIFGGLLKIKIRIRIENLQISTFEFGFYLSAHILTLRSPFHTCTGAPGSRKMIYAQCCESRKIFLKN